MSVPTRGSERRRFTALIAGLVGMAVLTVWFTPFSVNELQAIADLGTATPVLAVAGITVAVLLMVPRTVLAVASGLLFGWIPAFIYVFLGCMLGAGACFAAGRKLGRDFIADTLSTWSNRPEDRSPRARIAVLRWMQSNLVRLDSWLGRHGVVGVWTVRMVPISFGLTSYALGTAGVKSRQFLLGTVLSSGPGILTYTAVGGAALDRSMVPLVLGAASVSSLFTIISVISLKRQQDQPVST